MYRRCLRPLSIIVLLALVGCQRPFEFRSRDEIVNEVLVKDPSFADMLEKKTKVDEQIDILKSGFDNDKRVLKGEITRLKNELRSARENRDMEIRQIDMQLEPYREGLEQRIKGLVTELKLKESSLSAINKTIASYSKLSKKKGPAPEDPAAEVPAWGDKTSSLNTQAQELEKEIAFLRQELRLNRLKLKLLK